VLLAPTLPRVWVLNRLIVTHEPDGEGTLEAEALAAEASRVVAGRGERHVRITVHDDALGARLATGFTALGWSAERDLVMVDSRLRDADGAAGLVAVAGHADADRMMARIRADHPYGNSPDAVEQLAAYDRRCWEAFDGRLFVAPVEEPAAAAELRRFDAIGEVAMVETIRGSRRGGLGTAVVLAALAASRGVDEMTFLQADADDWPKDWYERLGFETIGAVWELDSPE
jgi:GNAT superfamily N-acetyltransferase